MWFRLEVMAVQTGHDRCSLGARRERVDTRCSSIVATWRGVGVTKELHSTCLTHVAGTGGVVSLAEAIGNAGPPRAGVVCSLGCRLALRSELRSMPCLGRRQLSAASRSRVAEPAYRHGSGRACLASDRRDSRPVLLRWSTMDSVLAYSHARRRNSGW